MVLAAAQSTGYAYLFKRQGALEASAGRIVLIVLTLTAGTTLLMWMGELITKRGVGNGISLLIFASILTALPAGISAWYYGGTMEKLFFPLIAIAIIVAVVFIQEGQRKIPIQYAKRMIGRRMTAGGSTYMPLRVNMAGVIPIIFAAAVMAFPPTIGQYFPQTQGFVNEHFSPNSLTFLLLEGFLIVIFTYFYTAVQFNPVDQADHLRKHGGYIPGIRPGPPTAQYLDRVLTRLTLPGALYLAIVAVLPSLFDQVRRLLAGDSRRARRHLGADRGRRRARHHAPDGVADDDALLRGLPQVACPIPDVLLLGVQGVGQGDAGQADRRRSTGSRTSRPATCCAGDRRRHAARPTRQADPRERRARSRRPDDRADPRLQSEDAGSGVHPRRLSRAR